MKRYAVQIINANGEPFYESLGLGASRSPQDAHLYTRLDLAEKKANQYRKQREWYQDAVVIELSVTGFPEVQ